MFKWIVRFMTSTVDPYGEGNGNPLQYSYLENLMDRGAWWAAVHGVAKSRTRQSDFTFTFLLSCIGEGKATHSSVLAWRIPGTGEPGGLLSMGSHRVGHDWSDLAAAAHHWYWCVGTAYPEPPIRSCFSIQNLLPTPEERFDQGLLQKAGASTGLFVTMCHNSIVRCI